MLLDETFDADEHLRDLDAEDAYNDNDNDDETKEMNFGTSSSSSFNDMISTVDNPEDMWE